MCKRHKAKLLSTSGVILDDKELLVISDISCRWNERARLACSLAVGRKSAALENSQ